MPLLQQSESLDGLDYGNEVNDVRHDEDDRVHHPAVYIINLAQHFFY